MQDNPYNPLKETFQQVQEAVGTMWFFKPNSAADFVKVAGSYHAEYLGAEMRHHRRRRPINSGALVWMIDDTWPAASWSVIDYYGLPKQVYYFLKRACEPLSISFRQMGGVVEAYVVNDLRRDVSGHVKVEQWNVDGSERRLLAEADVKVGVGLSTIALSFPESKIGELANSYLVATGDFGDVCAQEIYFHNLWHDIAWPDPGLSIRVVDSGKRDDGYFATVEVSAERFARCVNIKTAEDIWSYFNDNFFDVLPGQTRSITISSPQPFDASKLIVKHWLDIWE